MNFARILLAVTLLPASGLAQQSAPLSESLPADTLLYIEIPDIPALRDGLQGSAIGRIWNDESTQAFLGDMVSEATGQFDGALAMMAEEGVPVQFMSWEAMQSLEVGLSMMGMGDSNIPGVMVAAQIQFADGLGEAAFGLVSGMLAGAGEPNITTSETGATMTIELGGGAPGLMLKREGDLLRFTATNLGDLSGSLAASEAFQRARKQVMQPGMAVFGYYNPRVGIEMQRSFLNIGAGGAELDSMMTAMTQFAESAVGNAQGVSFSSGWKDGASVASTYVDFGGNPAGWAYASKAADRGLVQYVPADATNFSLATMGGTEGMNEFFAGFDAVLADESMAQTLAIWAEAEPISHSWFVGEHRPLLDGALNGFGERVLSYSSPTKGARTLIELSDPAAVQAAATPLVKTIAQLLDSVDGMPVALRAKRESPRNDPSTTVPVYYLRLKPEALPPEAQQLSMFLGGFEPSFAVSPDGWLVMSSTRAHVRSVIRSGLTVEERDITGNSEAKSFLDRAPESAVTLAWSDPRPGITSAMGMVQAATGLLGMQMDPEMLPVDLTKIPSAMDINQHLRPSESFAWMDEDGMKSWSSGSFGMADMLATAGYALPAGAMAFMYMSPMMANTEEMVMQAPVAIAEGDPADPVSYTHAELARLQTGIIIFNILNEEYPASLDQLLETSDEGQAYLDAPQRGITADGWGNAFAYRLTGDGFMLYSVGPNGTDEGGQGDDVTVEG